MKYFLISVISKNGWSTNAIKGESRDRILKYFFDKNNCILNLIELTEEEFNLINNRQISVNLDDSTAYKVQQVTDEKETL